MLIASVTEAKNRLSALLDRVRGGESVLIVDRGRPVARLEPAVSAGDADGRLARLERAGIVRVGGRRPPVALLAKKPPAPRKGRSGVELLLEERRTGR